MSPYLVVEVAYSQTLSSIERKVQVWMSIPTVVGVIVVQIDEQPSYTFPEVPTNLPGRMSEKEWLKVAEKSPKLGPIEVVGLKWSGKHAVSISVHQRLEKTVQLVRQWNKISKAYTDTDYRICFKTMILETSTMHSNFSGNKLSSLCLLIVSQFHSK